jgi:hypothetical protein
VFDANGAKHTVLLTAGCSTSNLDDADACVECVPSSDCYNDCTPCEICIGKPRIAEECDGTGGAGGGGAGGAPNVPQCSDGLTACSEQSPCPDSQYCLTGCCISRLR